MHKNNIEILPPKTAGRIALALVVIGVAARLLPHAWNTTPVTALILCATTFLGLRYSWMVMAGMLIISDSIIGFYQWEVMCAVYGSFALACIIGLFIKKYASPGAVVVGAVFSSALFFLITNWAVWQFGTMYPHTWTGLMDSYVMAIPFFKNALAGDLLYSGLFFTLFAYAARHSYLLKWWSVSSKVQSIKTN